MEEEGLDENAVLESLYRLRQFNSECLMCLDVILAATDYSEFCEMMN